MIPTELETLNRVRRMVGVLTDLLKSGSSLKDVSKHSYQMREKGFDMIYFGWSVNGICLNPRPTLRQLPYLKFFSAEVYGFPGVKVYNLFVYKDKVDFIMKQCVSGKLEELNIALDIFEDADLGMDSAFELLTAFSFLNSVLLSHKIVETTSNGVTTSREVSGWLSKKQVVYLNSLLTKEGFTMGSGFNEEFYFKGFHLYKVTVGGSRFFKRSEYLNPGTLDEDFAGHDSVTIESFIASLMDSPTVKYEGVSDNHGWVIPTAFQLVQLVRLHKDSVSGHIPINKMVWKVRGFVCRLIEDYDITKVTFQC